MSERAKREKYRCRWASNERLAKYHDEEWGMPVHDDRKHFEFLLLDAAQAGLSWDIVLSKRDGYRDAFDNFDPAKVARYDAKRQARLLINPNIIRNRLKVAAAITNAKRFLEVQREFGSFDEYIWRFVGGKPIANKRKSMKEVPSKTPESDAMSKDLIQRGFKFVGSTICYAYMQAAGMVNDHEMRCFRHGECGRKKKS